MKKNLLKLILSSSLLFSYNPNLSSPNLQKEEKIFKEIHINRIKSLSDYVEGIKYFSDTKTYGKDSSYWQNPQETIVRDTGNCSDKAIFLNDTLKKLNINVELVYGFRRKGDKYSHIYQQFFLNGDTFVIESSNKISIYNRENFCKGYIYKMHTNQKFLDYLTEKVKDYEKRNSVKLDFANLKQDSN